jgi:hypothetical protein
MAPLAYSTPLDSGVQSAFETKKIFRGLLQRGPEILSWQWALFVFGESEGEEERLKQKETSQEREAGGRQAGTRQARKGV